MTPEVKRKIADLHLGGIVYGELSNERIYTNGTLMGALLGGVDDAGKGVAGIEQIEDKTLTGTDGYQIYQQGNGGEEIPGTMTDAKDAVDGADVQLTIDRDIQWRVERILKDSQAKYKAAWGIAVVQDVQSGQILALADTDQIEAGSDDAKLNVARSVSQTFEPGSVGKVFTMSGLVQEHLHQMSDKFTVPDSLTLDGQTYKDSFNHGAERWTLAGVLEQSSNIGTILASDSFSDQKRYEYLTKFGIGQPSGLNLPGESQGLLTQPQTWDGRTRNTVLFGQGYTVNALQMTNAIAVIANQGVPAAVNHQNHHHPRRQKHHARTEGIHARDRRRGLQADPQRDGIRVGTLFLARDRRRERLSCGLQVRHRRSGRPRRQAELAHQRLLRDHPRRQPPVRGDRGAQGPGGQLWWSDGGPGVRADRRIPDAEIRSAELPATQERDSGGMVSEQQMTTTQQEEQR